MSDYLYIRILLLGALCVAGSISLDTHAEQNDLGAAAHNDEYSTMYELKPGDTPESVAEMFMGASENADELLRFNQLKRADFESRKLPVVAIPGKTRTAAVDLLNAASVAKKAAERARADAYAETLFREAMGLYERAITSRDAATYDKARHLALQARVRFEEAIARANAKAPVQQQGNIRSVWGDVQISSDGGISWESISADRSIKKEDIIRTGPMSRVYLQMEDRSRLKLMENSRLEFKNLRVDPRSKDRQTQLVLVAGTLHAVLTQLETARSSFLIEIAGAEIAVNGARIEMGYLGRKKGWVALHKGRAIVTARGEERFLPARKGMVLSGGKFVDEPAALMEPPFITDPEIPMHRTAVQQPLFAWRETGTRKPGAYRLEIARDAEMIEILHHVVLEEDSFKPEFLEEGTYYWRVSTIDRNGIDGLEADPARLEIKKNLDIVIMQKQEALEAEGRQIVSSRHLFFAQPAQADTSVVSFEYQINQQERQPLPRFFRLGGEGQMVVRVWGIGANGEQGPQQQIHVFVDRTPPAVTCLVDSRPQKAGAGNERAIIMIKARDPAGLSSLEYSFNNESFQPYTDPLEVEVTDELMFRYRAADGVGNLSRTKSLRIYPSSEK